ncbi:3-hydroxybutyryl-CoA dehydrogenase [Halalkalibacter wakoensis JCM 9140]|uniref:3-hydroxybutyryl-CoA dehydrogenase n=1 Tax=Halalkalibacter wakoensis JCM 9140 TaxID=1236970 RepID=W4Q713_9BACI|nr:3-hydroxybutyryl-CoA dehydrogenase [Halalkalibacter wakoensis JCM 9140]
MTIKKVAVIGSGTMGSQIAMVCALAGYDVILQDISEESLEKAKESLTEHMERRIKKGRLTEEQVKEGFARLTFSTSIHSLNTADFVIEAAVEKLDN